MLKRFGIGLPLVALICTSCTEDEYIYNQTKTDSPVVSSQYAISEEEALENLSDFLNGWSEESRSNGEVPNIQKVIPIRYNLFASRSETDSLQSENLVYIANFENEQGYAILAADRRIESPVIALTENGSISEQNVMAKLPVLQRKDGLRLKCYPLTGPGFVTKAEYEGEVFMNPNTVDLFDSEANDTYIGNFEPIDTTSYSGLLPLAMCLDYAQNGVSTLSGDMGQLPFQPVPEPTPPGGGGGSGNYTKTTYTNWTVTKQVKPILATYSDWYQSDEFSKYSPERRQYIIFGKKKKAPCGCFPLAVGKIFAHFQSPGISYNSMKVDWSALHNKRFENMSSYDKDNAAILMRAISSSCHALYFYEGTFTFPYQVCNFLKKSGYANAKYQSYDFDKTKGMLDKGLPVLIYGAPRYNVFKSHAWSIDGYKIKERSIITTTYDSKDEFVKERYTPDLMEMVHCAFGFPNSAGNGYFASGVFKFNDSRVEFDPSCGGSSKAHYDTYVKIITYSK